MTEPKIKVFETINGQMDYVVLECDEPYLVCGMCRYSEHCLLKPIKKAQSVPKLFDILYKIKIKFLMLLKGVRK